MAFAPELRLSPLLMAPRRLGPFEDFEGEAGLKESTYSTSSSASVVFPRAARDDPVGTFLGTREQLMCLSEHARHRRPLSEAMRRQARLCFWHFSHYENTIRPRTRFYTRTRTLGLKTIGSSTSLAFPPVTRIVPVPTSSLTLGTSDGSGSKSSSSSETSSSN